MPNEDTTGIVLEDSNTTLAFKPVLNTHEGTYVCAVDNGVGQDNDSIVLNVIGKVNKSQSFSQVIIIAVMVVLVALGPVLKYNTNFK